MVATLGPGKFYGSALPRPRIYTDVKFSEDRVDPPLSVVDPLLTWANDAHWSMGGLSFTRHRLQGRIEGSISKLRAQREKDLDVKAKVKAEVRSGPAVLMSRDEEEEEEDERVTPKAPVAQKKRRRLVEGSVDEEEGVVVEENKRKSLKRKLYDEFDAVAKKGGAGGSGHEGRRTSPRISKHGCAVPITPESAKGEIEVVRNTTGRLRVSPRIAKLVKDVSSSASRPRVSRRLVKSA